MRNARSGPLKMDQQASNDFKRRLGDAIWRHSVMSRGLFPPLDQLNGHTIQAAVESQFLNHI